MLTEERVKIHFKHQLEDDLVSPNLNIFIACFTTCCARLCLFEALDLVQDCVLYFDTDSVVFRSLPNQVKPQLGHYLGDFKEELSQDDYIVEFASGGPKNYGYQTKKGMQECKVRSVSLNNEGSKQLNYPVLLQNVIESIQDPLATGARQTNVIKPYRIVAYNREFKITTTATATGTSLNKRFNEQNNSCARAL